MIKSYIGFDGEIQDIELFLLRLYTDTRSKSPQAKPEITVITYYLARKGKSYTEIAREFDVSICRVRQRLYNYCRWVSTMKKKPGRILYNIFTVLDAFIDPPPPPAPKDPMFRLFQLC